MKRAATALLLGVLTASAAAQTISPRVPNRSFSPPRYIETYPIHPRAGRTIGEIPFPPEREWLRIDTPNFILYSSAGERRARVIADDFEKLTALLLRTSPYFRRPPTRTPVFVFAERRVAQPYLNATRGGEAVDAVGVTVRYVTGSTMLLDAGARGGDVTTPRHELVHDLLRHNGHPLPLWVEEGLAEYYSNTGLPIPEHASRLRQRTRFTMDEIFAMRSGDPRAFDPYFYAQSWGAVSTLMRLDPRAFFEMLRDLERGVDVAQALRTHYGKSIGELSVAMRYAGVASTQVPLGEKSVEADVRPVARVELLYQLATLLSNITGGDDEADRHFRAAIATAPSDAEANIRYAEFLFSRERFAEAHLTAEHALAFAPDEPRLYAVLAPDECASEQLLELTFQLFAAHLQNGGRSQAVRALRELSAKMPARTREQLEQHAAALEKMP